MLLAKPPKLLATPWYPDPHAERVAVLQLDRVSEKQPDVIRVARGGGFGHGDGRLGAVERNQHDRLEVHPYAEPPADHLEAGPEATNRCFPQTLVDAPHPIREPIVRRSVTVLSEGSAATALPRARALGQVVKTCSTPPMRFPALSPNTAPFSRLEKPEPNRAVAKRPPVDPRPRVERHSGGERLVLGHMLIDPRLPDQAVDLPDLHGRHLNRDVTSPADGQSIRRDAFHRRRARARHRHAGRRGLRCRPHRGRGERLPGRGQQNRTGVDAQLVVVAGAIPPCCVEPGGGMACAMAVETTSMKEAVASRLVLQDTVP